MTMVDFADAIGLRAAMERGIERPERDELPEREDLPERDGPAVELSPVEAARARLAARGLLQTQPTVLVPKEERRPSAAEPSEEGATPDQSEPQPRHWAAAIEDTWDVEPGGAEVTVPCPRCRKDVRGPIESTRFVCAPCDRAWRWATCGSCDALTLTVERQESWRCASCGQFTRSWWRTPAARRDAAHVVARRKHEAVQAEKALVRAGMRKRRWKLVAFAVVASTITAGAVLAVRATEPSAATGTDAVCARVARLGPSIGDHLATELPALEAEAAGAAPEVAEAVEGLRVAGPPGSASFLVARTALIDACTLVANR